MISTPQPRTSEMEELRLAFAEEVMYGNKDTNQLYPFDVRARFKWLIYHEEPMRVEDGQVISKLTSRRYSFFSPKQWDVLMNEKWFERNNRVYTILHDPIEQAKIEKTELKGYYTPQATGSLQDKLRKAKSATAFAKVEEQVVDQVETEEETKLPKRPAMRKGVSND